MKILIAVVIVVVLVLVVASCCRKKEIAIAAGGVYSVNRGEGEFGVTKVLVLADGVAHIRIYKNKFAERPTEIDLARNFGVGRNTVRQALSELERDGFVRRIRGKGTFVEDQKGPEVQRDRYSLALVMNNTKQPAVISLFQGFEAADGDLHYHALVRSTENDVAKQGNVLFHLLDYGLAGMALVPTTDEPTPTFQIHQLQKRGIPIVLCHRGVEGIRAPLVPIPFRDVGRMAAEAFLKHGHRRVASFCVDPAPAFAAYHEGLREVMRAGGGDLPDECVFVEKEPYHGGVKQKPILEALERMCRMPDRPTAIFVSSDGTAEMIYLLLGRLGLRVPEDVSLVSEGGPYREGAIAGQLTSIVIPEGEMGRRAVELLQQMRDGERSIQDTEIVVLPLQLSEGCTLGPPPKQMKQIQCLSRGEDPSFLVQL